MAKADSYQIFVDWDNDGGLNVGDFEATVESWVGAGSSPPTLAVSSVRSKEGSKSLLVTWANWNPFRFNIAGSGFTQGTFGGDEFGNPTIPFKFNQAGQGFDDGRFAAVKTTASTAFVDPFISKSFSNLIAGRVYNLTAWVYVPTGSPAIRLGVQGIGASAFSATNDAWELLTFPFAATLTTHVLEYTLTAGSNPAAGTTFNTDLVQIIGPGEDVSAQVLGLRKALAFSVGRDTARSLAAIKPGETALTLDNSAGEYSPDNPGSTLASLLKSGRPILIRGQYNGKVYNLFRGFLDEYDLDPNPNSQALQLGAVDLMGALADATLSTQLYDSVQTGEAVNIILDEVGWPTAMRDIDPGASTIRWWWEEGTNGLAALAKIVDSEGPPAIAYVDASGNMIFRDRHHRLIRTASTAIQATFRDGIEEPMFSPPLSFDVGWRDIVNNVLIDVDERRPDIKKRVWETKDRFVIDASSTKEFIVKANDPFLNAEIPSATFTTPDFIIESGTVDSVSISRTSGQTTTILITASPAGAVVIQGLALRAVPVPVFLSQQIKKDDTTSQDSHGIKSLKENVAWANTNDAKAIADLIVGSRAERLPIAKIRIKGVGATERLTQVFERKLSDRVHVVEMLQTFMDHDYFIEQISHNIAKVGHDHEVVFGCEKARDQIFVASADDPTAPPTFTFDVAGKGFDQGFFSSGDGFQLSTDVFILGTSTLNTDGLGY